MTREAELDTDAVAVITTDDYPDASLRANEQGMVEFDYEIDVTGKVTPGSCRIIRSTGYERLDRRSCEIVERRFRFRPALVNGQPVKSRRTQTVNWDIPGVVPTDPAERAGDAIRKINYLGHCAARARPELAERIVDMPFGSPEQAALVQSIDGQALGCAHPEERLKFTPSMLVGPLAEGLWHARFGKSVPNMAADTAPPPARNGTEAMAQCIVRRNPGTAAELIATAPSGTREAEVVRKIIPDLQPCITAGSTLRLNKFAIRNLLAVALYRDAKRAASPTP